MSNFRGTTHILTGRWGAWLLSGIAAAALLFSLLWKPAPPPRYEGLTAVRQRVPDQVAGFTLVGENPMSDAVKLALASADLLSTTYRADATGQEVDFTLIGGTDRSALHDPRSCLIGGGWRIENDRVETISGTSIPIRVCRVVNDEGANGTAARGSGFEAMYLYVVNGRPIDQVTQIRSQMLVSALIGRKNTPVCFVRFMRPVLADPQADAASRERFAGFVSQMWQTVRIPESQTSVQQVAVTR